jgi:hypothetical protein
MKVCVISLTVKSKLDRPHTAFEVIFEKPPAVKFAEGSHKTFYRIIQAFTYSLLLRQNKVDRCHFSSFREGVDSRKVLIKLPVRLSF